MRTGPATARRAEASDVSSVWPLARAFATSFVVERAVFERSFTSLLAQDRSLVLVATTPDLDGAGYLLAHAHTTFFANGPVVWIEAVVVDEGVRRSGIGRVLIAEAELWARATDAEYVALASRRARPFFLALGYEDSAVYFKKGLAEPG